MLTHLRSTDKLFLLGDFNIRVGRDWSAWPAWSAWTSWRGKRNSNGRILLDLNTKFCLAIASTNFMQKTMFKTTWQHPNSKTLAPSGLCDCPTTWYSVRPSCSSYGKYWLLDRSPYGPCAHVCQHHAESVTHRPTKDPMYVSALKVEVMQHNLVSSVNESPVSLPEQCRDINSFWTDLRDGVSYALEQVVGSSKRSHRDWFDESNI